MEVADNYRTIGKPEIETLTPKVFYNRMNGCRENFTGLFGEPHGGGKKENFNIFFSKALKFPHTKNENNS